MIDSDFIHEITETITRQKWRSVMTAFGVFWGMLILVILIGAGMGLKNGIIGAFTNMPSNSLLCMTKPTVLPYKGFDAGRNWNLTMTDVQTLRRQMPDVIRQVAIHNLVNGDSLVGVSYGNASTTCQLASVNPTYQKAIPHEVMLGRYINDIDMKERRPVCVVGRQTADILFHGESPLGQELTADGRLFTVVGVCQSTNEQIETGVNLSSAVIIPLTLMQQLYAQGDKVDFVSLILTEDCDALQMKSDVGKVIKEWHSIHPDDDEALTLVSTRVVFSRVQNLFTGIELLIWIVGLGTLFAGLIGISNIMMITVKERTQEIGVRRALGAEPSAIITQIMCESLSLTAVSGFVGLCLGLWLLSLLRTALGDEGGSFVNPYMPFWTAIASLLILTAGGLFAGWLPARRALAIKAIEALREE
jgi:putative ABC transport system permease protein